jgi:small subunit ribosomal protein S6e
MKLLIAYPATGCNKIIEIDDDNKLRTFYDRHLSEEVAGDSLGEEFKGYVFKIVGGQDKEGFPMRQGVLLNSRVKLLLNRGDVGFQAWRGREGERRRKSVRGCIVGPDLSVLQLVIVKKGASELPGLTTETKPRTLGPKRASKIRKLFNLSKQDDVRKYVVKHKKKIGKKEVLKGPKIQRLITPERLRRKVLLRKRMDERREKTQHERKQYAELLKKRKRESNEELRAKKKAKLAQQQQAKQTKA